MTSIVSICNMALSHIGARGTLADLSEDSTEALHCRTHYEQVRDETLRAHRWSFAARRVALGNLGNPPAGWAYRYAVPADCLLVREIIRGDRRAPPIPYRLESALDESGAPLRVLLTDQDRATLLYTARVEDPALFDPSFVGALSWALAARVALPIGAPQAAQQNAAQMAQYMLALARQNDAQEDGVMIVDHEPDWITARGAGSSDGWR